MTDEYEDDLPPLADVDIGDRYCGADGREFEVTCVLYGFDLVKVSYEDGEASISFADWLANPPTLIAKTELPDPVVYGDPIEDEEPAMDLNDDWSDEDDPEDEELMLQQVENMASEAQRVSFNRYRTMGYSYDEAIEMSYKEKDDLVNLYKIQRMARR